MVEILHALQSLWATLFPFALLWWNVMLYATCAKYYSWNRSWLRSQIAGRHFYGDKSCSFSQASNGGHRDKSPFSPSCTDASHRENREMGVFSLYQEGTCAEAVNVEKNDVGSILHRSHHLNHGFGVSIDPLPHESGSHILDQYGGASPACLKESGPHQVEEVVLCESTSFASSAQAIAASSHTSKLSSLCCHEGKQPQPSEPLRSFHWALCSVLLPNHVSPLAMLDVHCFPQVPLDYTCLQVNLHRKGNRLDLTVPMLIDNVSIKWPMRRERLQTFNRCCVPALSCGKKYQDVAWNFTKFSTSGTRNNDYAKLQFILSTTEGVNTFNTISPYDVMDSVSLRIEEQLRLRDFKIKSNTAYFDNEDSSSACSEDLGSMCFTLIISDDGCNVFYCTDAETSLDKDDGFEDSGVVYGKQCYGDDGYCSYYGGHEDIVIASVEDAEDVHGSSVHPAMYECDGFYDCSACCDVGYDGPHCVTDMDGIPGVALKSDTWWDEGAVLVDKQGSEEDSIEQEWQVV